MAFGDLSDHGQERSRRQRNRYARPLGCRPQPIERAVGRPRLLMRLVEIEAHAEHAGPALPAVHQRSALRTIQREPAEDREAVRMGANRVDRELVRIRVPHRRMDHRAIDAGCIHAGERLVLGIGFLPMVGRRRALRPDVYLGIDDHHGASPLLMAARHGSSATVKARRWALKSVCLSEGFQGLRPWRGSGRSPGLLRSQLPSRVRHSADCFGRDSA